MSHLRFGAFVAPHHPPLRSPEGFTLIQNPTYSIQRDVELVQLMDSMGFDEAWFGEHHSGAAEIFGDPALLIAHIAQVTRHIRLGAGVVSLPYHNPLWVADRWVFLDHLTRGRAMLGLGPGALGTDAAMIGLDVADSRDALEVDTDVLLHLLQSDEPISIETPRYRLDEARLHLAPYSDPCFDVATAGVVSPSGARLAGKHGVGLLSIAATEVGGFDVLGQHWDVVEERAKEFGRQADRSKWRLVGRMHLADTKDQAIRDVDYGLEAFCDYQSNVATGPHPNIQGNTNKERIDYVVGNGSTVIGTVDEAITQIERLWSQSQGGFGTFLILEQNWASPAATRHSYELFASHVMPYFQQSASRMRANADWCRSVRAPMVDNQKAAVAAFTERHKVREPQ